MDTTLLLPTRRPLTTFTPQVYTKISLDPGDGFPPLGFAAAGKHDAATISGELACGLKAEAAVGASDVEGAAGLVGDMGSGPAIHVRPPPPGVGCAAKPRRQQQTVAEL